MHATERRALADLTAFYKQKLMPLPSHLFSWPLPQYQLGLPRIEADEQLTRMATEQGGAFSKWRAISKKQLLP
jgi:hypothetical protein